MDTTKLPIKISFEQTPEHLKDLRQNHFRNTKLFWVWIVVGAVILISFTISILQAEFPTRMLMSYAIATVPVLIIWYVIFRLGKKRQSQSQNKELYGHRTMEFNLEQFKIKTTVSDTTYSWDAIVHQSETPLSYFLYISKIQALIVPKDAFSDEESRVLFEELCAMKIGSKERTINTLIEDE